MTPNSLLKKPRLHPGPAGIASAVLLTLFAFPALAAEVPESYRKAWSDASKSINENIERYRKGDAAIEVVGEDGQPLSGIALEIRQKTHEFLFGCNLFAIGQLETPELNRKYEEAFAGLFNFATLPFYWRELEPEEGKPRFEEGSAPIWRRPPPDPLVAWCQAHAITPKGHALMYVKNKFMPDWTARNDGKMLQAQGQKHIAQLAERYANDIAIWDVVNEELPRLAHPAEWPAVPDDYAAWCFEVAGKLFPKNVTLMINDGINQAHVTTAEYEKLIQGLLDRGLRVEGIGIQFHTSRGAMFAPQPFSPNQLAAVYDRLGKLGPPLYITEITVPGTGEDGPALQAAIVENLYRLWFSTPRMAGVTWWNLADGPAYQNENLALGGLLDKEMNPKPAHEVLDRLIHHEWKTNLSVKTDAAGKAQFRGFFGKYTVRATAGGREQEFDIDLSKDGPKQHRLAVLGR